MPRTRDFIIEVVQIEYSFHSLKVDLHYNCSDGLVSLLTNRNTSFIASGPATILLTSELDSIIMIDHI